jgi:hypothetical protein
VTGIIFAVFIGATVGIYVTGCFAAMVNTLFLVRTISALDAFFTFAHMTNAFLGMALSIDVAIGIFFAVGKVNFFVTSTKK